MVRVVEYVPDLGTPVSLCDPVDEYGGAVPVLKGRPVLSGAVPVPEGDVLFTDGYAEGPDGNDPDGLDPVPDGEVLFADVDAAGPVVSGPDGLVDAVSVGAVPEGVDDLLNVPDRLSRLFVKVLVELEGPV